MNKGVNVVIVNDMGNVLVLRRSSKESWYPLFWNFPGGDVNDGESLVAAAKREAKEESGLIIIPKDHYFDVYYYPDGKQENAEAAVYAFKSKIVGGKKIALDEDHTDFKWVSKNNWKKLKYTPSCEAILKILF